MPHLQKSITKPLVKDVLLNSSALSQLQKNYKSLRDCDKSHAVTGRAFQVVRPSKALTTFKNIFSNLKVCKIYYKLWSFTRWMYRM